jgi:ADP-dependent phosphofructokinase/glucokinase
MSFEEMGFMSNAISGLQAKKVLMATIVLAEDHVDVLGGKPPYYSGYAIVSIACCLTLLIF